MMNDKQKVLFEDAGKSLKAMLRECPNEKEAAIAQIVLIETIVDNFAKFIISAKDPYVPLYALTRLPGIITKALGSITEGLGKNED
jgi:hypothetical protein